MSTAEAGLLLEPQGRMLSGLAAARGNLRMVTALMQRADRSASRLLHEMRNMEWVDGAGRDRAPS